MPITKLIASSIKPKTKLITFTTPLNIVVTTLPKSEKSGVSQPSNVPSTFNGTCNACKQSLIGISATLKSGCKMLNNACIAICIGIKNISTASPSISKSGDKLSKSICMISTNGCNASDTRFITTANMPPIRSISGCMICITRSSTSIIASRTGFNA